MRRARAFQKAENLIGGFLVYHDVSPRTELQLRDVREKAEGIVC
jgi:hypothetical protein